MNSIINLTRSGLYIVTATLLFCTSAAAAGPGESAEGQPPAEASVLYQNYACGSCHGDQGRNPLPGMPSLAGQDKIYLLNQLKDFKSGARANGRSQTMIGYMATIADDEMAVLADWLSKQ